MIEVFIPLEAATSRLSIKTHFKCATGHDLFENCVKIEIIQKKSEGG